MSLISPRCCFTSLCVYLVLLIILVLRIVAYSLLCDRLLSMTHSVLLYTSRSPYKAVVESLVVLQLDFLYSTAEVLEPIAEAPFLFLSSVAYHLSSLEWTLFYIVGTIIQLVVCPIVHIIDLCN